MIDPEQVGAFLVGQRWFAGKGRPTSVIDVRRVATITSPEPTVTVELVTVRDDESREETVYQVPLAAYAEPQERLGHAFVGAWPDPDIGEVHVYDALHDRGSMAAYLRTFADSDADGLDAAGPEEALAFHHLPGHELDLDAHSTLFSGEQSNSSVAFGDDCLLKVFRKVSPGVNPDIEIHRVLTEAGNRNVAALYGWIEIIDAAGPPTHLAMLQEFLRTATDGWELALSSMRNLFAEADLHPDEVGGDFDGESHRLGAAVAEVHQVLRDHFWDGALDVTAVAAGMDSRLTAAVAAVPALAPHEASLRAIFADLAQATGVAVAQRVHGDLHLGQTLRTSLGWKLVDFEGEPAKPLSERVLPDSPWRDVAGMLRSFDYAARSVQLDLASEGNEAHQQAYRGNEWVVRNQAAFLEGYAAQTAPLTDADRLLVRAYEADKAVYEVVYEARNRPTWLDIPLSAIQRLTEKDA